MSADKPIIFISCGQFAKQEKDLGERIRELVNGTGVFRGYLAEDQSSAQSVTKHIFGRLDQCRGFICVMHERGIVSSPAGPVTRASVWIEQEIAIVAFLTEVLHRDIKTRSYLKKGINLEGVREKIILNPKPFETDNEILVDLQAVLQRWAQELSGADRALSTRALQELLEELSDNRKLLAKELRNLRRCSDQNFQELKRSHIWDQIESGLKEIIKKAYDDMADYNSCVQNLPSQAAITMMARSTYEREQLSPAKIKASKSVGQAIGALESEVKGV